MKKLGVSGFAESIEKTITGLKARLAELDHTINQLEILESRLTPWNPSWNLSTIPDDLIASEAGRRNNAKRQVRTGGIVWAIHTQSYSRCRCSECSEKRAAKRALKSAVDIPDNLKIPENQVTPVTLLSDPAGISKLLTLPALHRPCTECGNVSAYDYCQSCDDLYWVHASGCKLYESKHHGHRLTIVPFVEARI